MRSITFALLTLVAALQGDLWFGTGGLPAVWDLQRQVELQQRENADLAERNQSLGAEVADLKAGLEAIEERARTEMGMIGPAEVFFQIIDAPAGSEHRGR